MYTRNGWLISLIVVVVLAVNAEANFIYNGDFEAGGGSLDGWTVFTTPTGTNGLGMPQVVRFDTCAPGNYSQAAKFNVGITQCFSPATVAVLRLDGLMLLRNKHRVGKVSNKFKLMEEDE